MGVKGRTAHSSPFIFSVEASVTIATVLTMPRRRNATALRKLPRRARPDRTPAFVPPLAHPRTPPNPRPRTAVKKRPEHKAFAGGHRGRPATYAPNSWAIIPTRPKGLPSGGSSGGGSFARNAVGPSTTKRRGPDL